MSATSVRRRGFFLSVALRCTLLLVLVTAGCQGSKPGTEDDDVGPGDDDLGDDDTTDDDTTDDDDEGDDDAGEPPCSFPEPVAASIDVVEEVYEWGQLSDIDGYLGDAPQPVYHEIVVEEGSCRYLRHHLGECDPPCESPLFCDATEECVPHPQGLYGGALTINGLTTSVEIDPDPDYYTGSYSLPLDLPDDLFFGDDTIQAELEGADFPAFTVEASGVETMFPLSFMNLLELTDGQDAEIFWSSGSTPDACVEVRINSGNGGHGLPLTDIIQCVAPDTGLMSIPSEVIDPFPFSATPDYTAGIDWPPSELTRYTRGLRTTEFGPAELVVRSTYYFPYEHLQ